MNPVPEYTDGYFALYDIVDNSEGDYPNFSIRARNLGNIYYRDIAVFDRTRLTFEQQDIEVTHKIRIPRFSDISSNCVCLIDNQQFKVFNKADVFNDYGFPETELTLVTPTSEYEVIENDD
jgi:hypothetical protein